MGTYSNRRRFHRFPFDAAATLIVPGQGRSSCELLDLSIGGASLLLECGQLAQPGGSGLLELALRGLVLGDEVEIRSKVDAVWQDEGRLGCRFVSVDPDSFAHLKTLIEANLGDPCLLDRELTQLAYWPGVESSSTV